MKLSKGWIDLDFKQLETFVAVVKYKSFSKAANKLFLTQPTVSNHIQNLEKELKTILINRGSKSISLTRAGQILFKYATDILNKRENALFSLNEFKGKIEGILEISSSTIPEEYMLPDIIFEFNKKYPLVQYRLMKYDTQKVTEKILSGEIDFGIVGSKKESRHLEYEEILGDEIILIGNKDIKYDNRLTLKEKLLKHPIIMREKGSGTRDVLEKMLEKNDIDIEDLNVVAYIESNETIKKFVKLGMGVSFISKRAVEEELERGELKHIKLSGFEVKRMFYFVYHKSRILSPLSETFKSFISEKKEG